MNLDDLRAEFERETIGHEWLAAVRSVCRTVVRRYPPEIYASSPKWADSLDDLVQDVVTNALLRDGQAQYLMDVCETTTDFQRLLARQVAHVLARNRRRTVIDQLLDRSKPLLSVAPFERVGRNIYVLPGAPTDATPSGYREAVAIVRGAARVPHRGTERAPTVFSTDTLRAVLIATVSAHGPTTINDLGRILTNGLTPLLPSVLGSSDSPEPGRSGIDPEDVLNVQEAVTQVVDTLKDDELALLRWKLLAISDTDIAGMTGLSRPTVANQKQAMLETVKELVSSLPPDLHDHAFDQLTVRLTLPTLPDGYIQDPDA